MEEVLVIHEQDYDISWVCDVITPDKFDDYIKKAQQHLLEKYSNITGYKDLPISIEEVRIRHTNERVRSVSIRIKVGARSQWEGFEVTRVTINDYEKPVSQK